MWNQPAPKVQPFHCFHGMHIIKKPSNKIPGAQHFAVLVAGEPLRSLGYSPNQSLIFHRTERMTIEAAENTGVWQHVEKIPDYQVPEALGRTVQSFSEPQYDLFTNNCETTARFIATGEKRSDQVNVALISVALVGLVWLLNRD